MGQVTRPSVHTCVVVAVILIIISVMFRHKDPFECKEKRRFRSLLHYFLCACVHVFVCSSLYVCACMCVCACFHMVDREVVQCLLLQGRSPLHCHQLKYSNEMYTEHFLVVTHQPAILLPKSDKDY